MFCAFNKITLQLWLCYVGSAYHGGNIGDKIGYVNAHGGVNAAIIMKRYV